MLSRVHRLRDERASVAAEYALLMALIVIVIAGSIEALGPAIRNLITSVVPFI